MIMSNDFKKQLIFMFLLVTAISLNAQENSDTEEKKAKTIFTGSIDAYYMKSFTDVPTTATIPTYTNDEFSLGWVSAGVKHEGSNYGFQANIAFGPKNDAFYKTALYKEEESTFNFVRDAFGYFSPTEKLTFSAGLFQNFYGYEWDDVHLNGNYSHGYIYSISSSGFAGAKADYAFDDNWNVMIGVFNNLNQREESNSNKLFASSLAYTSDFFEGTLSYLTSKEPDGRTYNVIDLVGAVIFSDAVTIGYNVHNVAYDNDEALSANLFGAALYPLFTLNDKASIGIRGEVLIGDDDYIFNFGNGTFYNATLSFNYHIGNLKLTPEIRLDGSSEDFFINNQGEMIKNDSFAILGLTYLF